MIRTSAILAFIGLIVLAAVLFLMPEAGAAFHISPEHALSFGALGMAGEAAAVLPWRRIRESSLSMVNVIATGRATGEIPRYRERTLLKLRFKMGGTTYTRSHVTAVRVKLGDKLVWGPIAASDLERVNKYGEKYSHANYFEIDFTTAKDKTIGGEFGGGLDISTLPPGRLYVEVDNSGATAPTLDVQCVWAPAQGFSKVKRLIEFTGRFGVAGRNTLNLNFGGATVLKYFLQYSGNDYCGTSATAVAGTNTGNGAAGAVTVSAGAKVGTHTFVAVEPGANVGTFIHLDPDGLYVKTLTVASAYSGGGLAWTLADGATDFVSGDSFTVEVGQATNGNVYRAEIKKNGGVIFDMQCNDARKEQKDYKWVPQSQMFVVDFTVERNPGGSMDTADAASLENNFYVTAADDFKLYAEVLQDVNTL